MKEKQKPFATYLKSIALAKKVYMCEKKIAELEIKDSRIRSKIQRLKQEVNVCMTKVKD